MSSNTYSNPLLFIGNTQITSFSDIMFKDSGTNQASSLSVTITDPLYREAALIGKQIVFYLNYGSFDNVPFFRGIIRDIKPSDKNCKISAFDVRTLLAGKDTLPISLTDTDNYDGYTLSQFLRDYIEKYINVDDNIIGLDMLNESDPVVTLSGMRGHDLNALGIVNKLLKDNDDDLTDIRANRLTVVDDGYKSNICFIKEQSINSGGISFSYANGIESVSVKKRNKQNIFSTRVGYTNVLYKHNNMKSGAGSAKIEGEFEYPDEAVQSAYTQATKAQDEVEISLKTNKGHYLGLGNVINITLRDYEDINGKYRIVSKSVKLGKSAVDCTLQLSKEGPRVDNYINTNKIHNINKIPEDKMEPFIEDFIIRLS